MGGLVLLDILWYGEIMKLNETPRKNGIRFHINKYELLGNPYDLIRALDLIHNELLNINKNYERFLWLKTKKNDKR